MRSILNKKTKYIFKKSLSVRLKSKGFINTGELGSNYDESDSNKDFVSYNYTDHRLQSYDFFNLEIFTLFSRRNAAIN